MDSAWSGHLRRLRCTVNEDTRIQNGVQLFCRTATDPQHSPVSLSAESTVAGLAAINTPRLWQCDAGWRSKQPTVHGSLTTSHRCSVTFIGYECHSGSSSNSLCLFSAACMVCLCYTCTRTVPCGRHGQSSSTLFRFDARAARSPTSATALLKSLQVAFGTVCHLMSSRRHHWSPSNDGWRHCSSAARVICDSFDSCSYPVWHSRWFYFFLLLSALEVFFESTAL